MRNPSAGFSKGMKFGVVEMDAVRIPYIGPGPTKGLHISKGAHAESFERKAFLVLGFT